MDPCFDIGYCPLKQARYLFIFKCSSYDGKSHKSQSKEKAHINKLLHKVKREKKGALREIRRDNAFLGRFKIGKQLQRYVIYLFYFFCITIFIILVIRKERKKLSEYILKQPCNKVNSMKLIGRKKEKINILYYFLLYIIKILNDSLFHF